MSTKNILLIAIILLVATMGAVSAMNTFEQTNKLLEENGYSPTNRASPIDSTYHKGNENVSIIFLENSTVDLDYLEKGYSEKTINNTHGFYRDFDGKDYGFAYNSKDGALMIKFTDKNIIDKIVLGN